MGSYPNIQDELDDDLYQAFIAAHETRLRANAVPECKWRTLCKKLDSSIFDAGDNFVYLEEESSEDDDSVAGSHHLRVYTLRSMSPEDEDNIYLIDHAWTYTLETAKPVLEKNLALVDRMSAIMEIETGNSTASEIIENILRKMWLFNNCYLVQRGSEILSHLKDSPLRCWYILDEFGSRISFSDKPLFEMVPFLYAGDQLVYTLLFPKLDVSEREEVTILYPNIKPNQPDDIKRALQIPWRPCDFTDVDFNLHEPSVDYFASGRREEILPEGEYSFSDVQESPEQPLEVYSEYSDIAKFLTNSSFKVVDQEDKAKIFWLAFRECNIRNLVEKYPAFRYINQFPSEHVLINKDLLAVICRRHESSSFNPVTLDSYPEWLPTTFNLKTELLKFISYFQNRNKRNLDNIWICKPFNLARGIYIHISDNIAQILKMTGAHPMVACKYITDPVLFPIEDKGLVKMDIRYIVLLRNTNPLEVYVYERFWLRFANKSFVLSDFNDYERHFTVMNYSNYPLKQMYCHDFIKIFEDYYSSYKWCDIEEKIYQMIKDIFVGATSKEPPAGIGAFAGSRAMYGLDIMLRWDRNHDVPEIKPMILEVNWMPDCIRACQYYPEFYNDIFSVLFLGNTKDKHVVKL